MCQKRYENPYQVMYTLLITTMNPHSKNWTVIMHIGIHKYTCWVSKGSEGVFNFKFHPGNLFNHPLSSRWDD